ncbi:MAG: T9SS type A sorting domain-containing protein [bacterium]|nr:T9SS type A sorting domain-containing protein [bacterium]
MNKKLSIFLLASLCMLVFASSGWTDVILSNKYAFFRGAAVFNGQLVPIGTIIDAYDPQGTHCGTWTVDSVGFYGSMPVYGDDLTVPDTLDEGALEGELISFKINGHAAVIDSGSATWHNLGSDAVNISAGGVVDFELLAFDDVALIQAPDTSARFTVGVKNLGDGLDMYGVNSSSARGWLTIDMPSPAYADPLDTAYVYFDVYIDVWDTLDVDTITFSVFSHLDTTIKVDAAYVVRGFGDTLVQFTVLTPAADSVGQPGQTVAFSIEVQNNHLDPMFMDYYGVDAVSQNGWSTGGDQMIPVAGQSSGWVSFEVTIPGSVSTLSDTISYTLFSHLDSTKKFESSVALNITLSSTTIMAVTDPPAGRNGINAGETVRLLIGARNDGTSLDIYSVTSSSAKGWTTIDSDSAFNSPGNTVYPFIDVVVPDLAFGMTDTIDYTIASLVDPSQTFSSTVEIATTIPTIAFDVYNLPTNKDAAPGDQISLSVGVINKSQIADSYELTSVSSHGWSISLNDSIHIQVDDSALFNFDITVPLGIPDLTDTISFTIRSFIDTTVSRSGSLLISVKSTDVDDDNNGLPTVFAVEQNYPNPFNPTTTIGFALPSHSDVQLSVINLLGQTVQKVDLGNLPAGEHLVEYDGMEMASGVYFYRIETDFGAETRKMVLLK